MDYREIITIEPDKTGRASDASADSASRSNDVLDYLAGGMSEDDILSDFPDLTRDDIRACLAFAADRERKLSSAPPAA